jgi:hypothetical protein
MNAVLLTDYPYDMAGTIRKCKIALAAFPASDVLCSYNASAGQHTAFVEIINEVTPEIKVMPWAGFDGSFLSAYKAYNADLLAVISQGYSTVIIVESDLYPAVRGVEDRVCDLFRQHPSILQAAVYEPLLADFLVDSQLIALWRNWLGSTSAMQSPGNIMGFGKEALECLGTELESFDCKNFCSRLDCLVNGGNRYPAAYYLIEVLYPTLLSKHGFQLGAPYSPAGIIDILSHSAFLHELSKPDTYFLHVKPNRYAEVESDLSNLADYWGVKP